LGKASKKYRVALLGMTVDIEAFRENMAKLGVSGSALEKYVKKTPAVLKRDLRLEDARRYAEAIINAGGLVNIQETGQFPETKSSTTKVSMSFSQDFVLCPNCGFKQKKQNSCIRCGFDLDSPP